MIFKAGDLVVRMLRKSDFAGFHEMQSDDHVMKYTTENGQGLTEETNRSQLAKCISSYNRPGNNFWVWAIINSREQFVGTCAIVCNEKSETEIGYRFLRRCWGRGYGMAIVNPLIDFGVGELKKSELVAYVDIRNIASVKILEASKMDFDRAISNQNVTDRRYFYSSNR